MEAARRCRTRWSATQQHKPPTYRCGARRARATASATRATRRTRGARRRAARTPRGGAAGRSPCNQTTNAPRAGRARASGGARPRAARWRGRPTACRPRRASLRRRAGAGRRDARAAARAGGPALADEGPAHFCAHRAERGPGRGRELVTAATTWRCFPSLVIVGAEVRQHGPRGAPRGTSIAFSRDKELHFRQAGLCPGPWGTCQVPAARRVESDGRGDAVLHRLTGVYARRRSSDAGPPTC